MPSAATWNVSQNDAVFKGIPAIADVEPVVRRSGRSADGLAERGHTAPGRPRQSVEERHQHRLLGRVDRGEQRDHVGAIVAAHHLVAGHSDEEVSHSPSSAHASLGSRRAANACSQRSTSVAPPQRSPIVANSLERRPAKNPMKSIGVLNSTAAKWVDGSASQPKSTQGPGWSFGTAALDAQPPKSAASPTTAHATTCSLDLIASATPVATRAPAHPPTAPPSASPAPAPASRSRCAPAATARPLRVSSCATAAARAHASCSRSACDKPRFQELRDAPREQRVLQLVGCDLHHRPRALRDRPRSAPGVRPAPRRTSRARSLRPRSRARSRTGCARAAARCSTAAGAPPKRSASAVTSSAWRISSSAERAAAAINASGAPSAASSRASRSNANTDAASRRAASARNAPSSVRAWRHEDGCSPAGLRPTLQPDSPTLVFMPGINVPSFPTWTTAL